MYETILFMLIMCSDKPNLLYQNIKQFPTPAAATSYRDKFVVNLTKKCDVVIDEYRYKKFYTIKNFRETVPWEK